MCDAVVIVDDRAFTCEMKDNNHVIKARNEAGEYFDFTTPHQATVEIREQVGELYTPIEGQLYW